MELAKKLKILEKKRFKALVNKNEILAQNINTEILDIKKELRKIIHTSNKTIKCPACHGEGWFGDGWNEESSECSYCYGLGFTNQKYRMKYVRSLKNFHRK